MSVRFQYPLMDVIHFRAVWHQAVIALSLIGFSFSSGWCDEPDLQRRLAEIDRAIAAGTDFLVKQQRNDGTWRSKTYGLLKDGTSLTPLALWAMPDTEGTREARVTARKAISRWIASPEKSPAADGNSSHGDPSGSSSFQYPVYAAGLLLGSHLQGDDNETRRQQAIWIKLIQEHQLARSNGWSPDDRRYGGWGYSHHRPRKPGEGATLSPLDEPNLSATVFALEGLSAARPDRAVSDPVKEAARMFVERCQNFRSDGDPSDARFNDGGFHFLQDDPVRNKPGVAGTDSRGDVRFVSYGSATADGLRALLLCGTESNHPRVIAAQRWLLDHFGDGQHPGAYPTERASLKPSLDYYYAASVARAFQLTGVPKDHPLGQGRWAGLLAQRMVSLQRADGSWSNPAVDVREDDPLIATPMALRTLQLCRDELASPPNRQ